jgi:hypothetical protein
MDSVPAPEIMLLVQINLEIRMSDPAEANRADRSGRPTMDETPYHCSTPSFHPVDALEPVGGLAHLHPAPPTAASLKTRAALLRLDDYPSDSSAIGSLWEENHEVIEEQMRRHLSSSNDATLRKHVLSDVILQSKYFCDEIDEPRAWVARSANLAARRVALQRTK